MGQQLPVVTAVVEDYLKALWSAHSRGHGMSVNQLAAKMGVVASTASENVSRLKAMGLVDHEPYKRVHLSDEGRKLAVGMIRRHRIIETYLHVALGFESDELHVEAEILEHAISDRLLQRLDEVLGFPTRDPHGDPIPRPDGTCVLVPLRPLAELHEGDIAIIARFADRFSGVLRDLIDLGIELDACIHIIEKRENNSMLVRLCMRPTQPGSDPEELHKGTDVIQLNAEHVNALFVVDERL